MQLYQVDACIWHVSVTIYSYTKWMIIPDIFL